MSRSLTLLLSLLIACSFPQSVFSWGTPHITITKAALDTLPDWQKQYLGPELSLLGEKHCLIPDNVFTDKEAAKFAAMDSSPGVIYLEKLHLPLQQPENLESVRYFMEKAVTALRSGNVNDGARYMGTICHTIEDFGSPSHTVPGDNMFTLMQQFMPPSEGMKDKLLHSPVESGDFPVSIAGYTPHLLGITVEEASWRLLHRMHEGIINARSTTFPIIQALYADDKATVIKHQTRAAIIDAQIVADAMFTILSLGQNRFDGYSPDQKPQTQIGIANFYPLEAKNLYYPQSHFFSSPYWGHARNGVVLEGGNKAVPIRLKIKENEAITEKVFTEGISTGMGKPLTWLLPVGVYHRFTVHAGLQSGLGDKGRVEFTVLADGKPLASAIVKGGDPAHRFECDITGCTQLQLAAASKGLDPKSNYAVWAEPILSKEKLSADE